VIYSGGILREFHLISEREEQGYLGRKEGQSAKNLVPY